jgi:hypothetical protein
MEECRAGISQHDLGRHGFATSMALHCQAWQTLHHSHLCRRPRRRQLSSGQPPLQRLALLARRRQLALQLLRRRLQLPNT